MFVHSPRGVRSERAITQTLQWVWYYKLHIGSCPCSALESVHGFPVLQVKFNFLNKDENSTWNAYPCSLPLVTSPAAGAPVVAAFFPPPRRSGLGACVQVTCLECFWFSPPPTPPLLFLLVEFIEDWHRLIKLYRFQVYNSILLGWPKSLFKFFSIK